MSDISNKLLELRKKSNLTQDQLAGKIEVSKQTISKYERGIKAPSRETLDKLAEVFDVSTDYILGRSNIEKLNENFYEKFKYIMDKLDALPDEDRQYILNNMERMTEVLEEKNKIIKKK